MSPRSIDGLPDIGEIIRVVEADYERTVDFIKRTMTRRQALMSLAVTVATGLAGLALANDEALIALLGIPIVLFAELQELRMREFYRIARDREVTQERLIHNYLVVLREENDVTRGRSIERLHTDVLTYRFGIGRSFELPRWGRMLKSAWRRGFSWFYALLLTVLIVVSVIVAMSGGASDPLCGVTDNSVFELSELPAEIPSGHLRVEACPADLP